MAQTKTESSTCRIAEFQGFLHGGYSHAALILKPIPNIQLPAYLAQNIAVDSFELEFVADEVDAAFLP